MAVLMVMSCWVFFAPEADAADVIGVPAGNGSHYRTADKYGTPVFDGELDQWFKFSSGDDHFTLSYPKYIYLDVSETLESAGYYFNAKWHFGVASTDSCGNPTGSYTDYRLLVGANVWGDNSQWSGMPDKYYTMTNNFTNYTIDASLPKGGTLVYGASGTDTNTYDVRLVNLGYSNQGSDQFSRNDYTHTKYLGWRTNQDQNEGTIYLKGTPKGTVDNAEYNTAGNGYNGYGLPQNWTNKWNNNDNTLFDGKAGKGNDQNSGNSSYMQDGYTEMQWFVTVYDKAGLGEAVTNAQKLYDNNNAYQSYITAGSWSTFTTAKTNAENILTTREVTQKQIDDANTALTNAMNALAYKADNSALVTALSNANAIKNETGYTAKYTQATRTALETAITNATNSSLSTGVQTYKPQSGNSYTAGVNAYNDQTTITNLTNALTTAINAMAIQNYLITFKDWQGNTYTAETKEYPYGTPAANITQPTWTTTPPYDDSKHYSYTAPTIADVTGAATYQETRTDGAHSFYFDDKTDSTHDRKCLNCSRVIDNEPHVKANGKSTGHTCTADGYITYQCGECGQTFVVSGYILDANGNEVEDKAAHKWADLPTKIDDNQHGYKCSICSEFDPARKINHEWALGKGDTDIIQAPTCMEDGSGNYYCTCGATKVDTIAKLPYDDAASHVIGNVTSNGNGTHSGKCTVEGCNYASAAVGCTDTDGDGDCKCDYCTYVFTCVYNKKNTDDKYLKTEANCLNAAVYYYSCDCGAKGTETFSSGAPLGHTYTKESDIEKDPANCTDPANNWYICSRCDACAKDDDKAQDKFYAVGEALGHNYTLNEAKDNCVDNDDGTHSFHCQNGCGTTGGEESCKYGAYTYDSTSHTHICDICRYTDTDTHTMSDWETDEGATDAAEATQSRHCTVCAYTENNQKCNYTQTTHVDATCKYTGYTTYTCSDCGHGYTVVHGIDGNNHSDYGTYDVTVTDATCTATGEYKKVCKGCGANLETGLELSIDPTNHGDHSTTVTGAVTATCTINGESGKIVCDGCGGTITENVIGGTNPDNHVSTTDHEGLAPTCTADGYTAYETCDDPNCPVGTIGKEPIGKLGHKYTGDAVDNKNGTHSYKCKRYDACKTIGTEADGENGKIACLDAEPVYTNPECNVDGYWTHTCDTCGYEWTVTDEGSALIHDYSINADGTNVIDFDDEDKHAYYCKNGCETYGVGAGNDATDKKEDCDGGEADCLNKAVCSVCDKEYGEALGHDFSANSERIHSLNDGTHNYKCSRCDVYGTVEGGVDGTIDCLDAEPVVTNPTCLDGGYTTHTCDTCGYSWTTDPVIALGHDYTETKHIDADHLKDAATCEEAATYWYDCSRCDANAKNDEDATDMFFSSGKPNGHTFDRNEAHENYIKTPADCTNNAVYYVSCSVCYKSSALVEGQTKTFADLGSMLGHKWIEYVDETDTAKYLKEKATCDTAAVYYKSCERCKISSKDVTGQTATFSYGKANDHVFTEQIQDSAHRLSSATCVAKAVYYYDCLNCKVNAKNLSEEDVAKYTADGTKITYEYGATDPNNGHPKDKLETVDYLAPTCELGGHNKYQHCTLCGADIGKVDATTDSAYGPLGHNFKGDYEFDVTTDKHKRACLNKCGQYGAEEECNFGDWIQSKNAEGKEIHSKNCICGNTETELCSGGEATCLKRAVCSTCNKEYGSTLTHSYPDTWTKVEGKDMHKKVCANNCGVDLTGICTGGTATCSKLAECTECKAEYGKYAGHTFGTYEKSADASCGVNAKETAKCAHCDATDTRDIEGTALQHIMGDYVYTTAPTCKDEGEEKSTCTLDCGYFITRPVPADKNAHVWSDWVEIGGDCASGIVKQRECTICGAKEKITDTENLEHSWVTVASVKPGCETDGYTKQQCSKCKFVRELSAPATGHSFTGEFTFYSAATCTSAEIHARPCANHCGKYEFKEIEGTMLEHNFVIWAGSEATCTRDGYTDIYHCVDCAYEEGGAVLPMLGHADNNGDGQCDSCNGQMSNDGSSACGCICHKQNAFMKFIFKIVNFFWKLFKIGKTCDCGAVHW